MFKIIALLAALIAVSASKPLVVSAPLIAAPAPIVTASSSQYYHRINNGFAAYVAAPAAYVASAAPVVASPYVASPYVAAPYVAAPAASIVAVIALLALCGAVQSSVEHGQAVFPVFPAAQQIPPPVVTSASSQYFERTFNRLIAPPVIPVAPAPPVFVQPTPNAVPIAPSPSPGEPVQPNIAIAVATAHAAAPVATILLPPYPFGPPPTIGFIPPSPPINVPDESRKESTTQPTTKVETKATTRQPEMTTPLPAGSDNSFSQALPSNQNINFKQFYGPPPQLPPQMKPQKVKTSVEIVPVPLTYIAPPPLKLQAVKTVKHYHTYVPLKTKLIVRPVHSHSHPIRIVRRPVRLVHRVPLSDRIGSAPNVRRPMSREIEPTTFSPFVRSATKPPRV